MNLPEGDFGGGYPKYKIPLYNSFKSHDQNYTYLNQIHIHETMQLIQKFKWKQV